MPDIFNRQSDSFGGSFAADQVRMTFPALTGGGSQSGLLLQQLGASYMQQVTRLFEIGSPAVYYVSGRTSGQLQIARAFGPRKIAAAFYQTYGDVCNAATNTLHFSMTTGCNTESEAARAAFTAYFCVITSVGLNVGASDVVINESLSMMFSSFAYS